MLHVSADTVVQVGKLIDQVCARAAASTAEAGTSCQGTRHAEAGGGWYTLFYSLQDIVKAKLYQDSLNQ